VSRIWQALREAERQKTRASLRGRSGSNRSSEVGARKEGDRRASPRSPDRVLLLVYGSDSEKQPFHEEAETLDVAENGCSIPLEASVARGQRLFLANIVNQAEVQAHVIHVGRRIRGKARIGLEFLRPAPEFWFPAN